MHETLTNTFFSCQQSVWVYCPRTIASALCPDSSQVRHPRVSCSPVRRVLVISFVFSLLFFSFIKNSSLTFDEHMLHHLFLTFGQCTGS